jgi:acyl dehydratase
MTSVGLQPQDLSSLADRPACDWAKVDELRIASAKFFEDFAIGDRVAVPGRFTLTPDSVRRFAEMYDPQDIHLNRAAAANSVFGRLTASGWQTLAATMRLMVEARPFGSCPIVGGGVEVRWIKPAHPGDVLTAEAEIVDMRPLSSRPDRGIVVMRVTTSDQSGSVLISQLWTAFVPRKPPVPTQRPKA